MAGCTIEETDPVSFALKHQEDQLDPRGLQDPHGERVVPNQHEGLGKRPQQDRQEAPVGRVSKVTITLNKGSTAPELGWRSARARPDRHPPVRRGST